MTGLFKTAQEGAEVVKGDPGWSRKGNSRNGRKFETILEDATRLWPAVLSRNCFVKR
jgi:hypothetical protein